jgi:hypothetical protein
MGFACVALLVLPMTACSLRYGNNKYTAKTTLTETVDHIAGSALVVNTRNGRIEVMAEPQRSDVLIEATIRCRGDTQAEADRRLAATTLSVSRGADRGLVVKPVFPEQRRGGDGASITIRLPDADGVNLDTSNGAVIARSLAGNLVIDTSNGSVEVTGHDGPARLDTSNGSIVVSDHEGRLALDTSNGSIKVRNVEGDVVADTSNSSVWVDGANGTVSADTSNGSIRIWNAAGEVTADTSNGSIAVSLTPAQSGPLNLDTSNGSISVEVGSGFVGSVSFRTSRGSITVNDTLGRVSSSSLSNNKGRIIVGEGGQPSRLDTSNGRITFTIAG